MGPNWCGTVVTGYVFFFIIRDHGSTRVGLPVQEPKVVSLPCSD